MNTAFRIRSYVIRGGCTHGQTRALSELWPAYGLELSAGMLDFAAVFGRSAPTYLEIGFGSGQTLLAAAKAFPEMNFIGVETHRPGIGALLMGIEEEEVGNIRIFRGDVIDVLAKAIPDRSLAGVQIFFPDPWQKRRHNERRLVQSAFINNLLTKIQKDGSLHLATDWEDYSKLMLKVVSAETKLTNLSGHEQFGERSPFRPTISKFEQRALNEGRSIWELQLINNC